MKKIALPTNGNSLWDGVALHFGRAEKFLVYDTEKEIFEVYANPEVSGGVELPPRFLDRLGVEVVICFGLGRPAFNLFGKFGIEMLKANEGNIAENVKGFQGGNLRKLGEEDIF